MRDILGVPELGGNVRLQGAPMEAHPAKFPCHTRNTLSTAVELARGNPQQGGGSAYREQLIGVYRDEGRHMKELDKTRLLEGTGKDQCLGDFLTTHGGERRKELRYCPGASRKSGGILWASTRHRHSVSTIWYAGISDSDIASVSAWTSTEIHISGM